VGVKKGAFKSRKDGSASFTGEGSERLRNRIKGKRKEGKLIKGGLSWKKRGQVSAFREGKKLLHRRKRT